MKTRTEIIYGILFVLCVCDFFISIGLHSQSSCGVQVVATSHRSSVNVLIAVTADIIIAVCVYVCVFCL